MDWDSYERKQGIKGIKKMQLAASLSELKAVEVWLRGCEGEAEDDQSSIPGESIALAAFPEADANCPS